MPPPIALGGAALVGSSIAGGMSAHSASNQASRARQLAQQQYQWAQQFRPDLYQVNPRQQRALYEAILRSAPGRAVERQQRQQLTSDFGQQTEQGRQQVVESSARRGLFRSGIGAEQEREFLADQNTGLNRALLNQQMGFQQQRQHALGQAQQFLSGQQNQQADLYRLLLNNALGQASAAGQQTQMANQAWGNAIGGPLNTLTNLGFLGMY